MRILFPTSECVPFAKTGGLADVAGSLPTALAALGHEVHVVMPLYRQARNVGIPLNSTLKHLAVPLGKEILTADVWFAQLPNNGPTVHLLQYDPFFNRAELYRTAEGDYKDNDRRFAFFCRAVLELGKALGGTWDILHGHDWHTGLIPAYLKTLYKDEPAYRKVRSLFTIHNLGYQGIFPPESFGATGLPDLVFSPEGLEFWGKMNFLKSGLVYSDFISTVSPTYAQEIQAPEVGYGLDGVLRARHQVLSGILNGVDYSIWDPWTDPRIPIHFKAGKPQHKLEVKQFLLEDQRLFSLPDAPLLGIISRLDDQKGFDILAEIAEKVLQMNVQMIILGTGHKKYHEYFLQLKAKFPRKLALNLTFDDELAHRIYAGCDMFLMPSKYEPCGLGQLISLRYGTIPVVRHTGGLADTVTDFDGHAGNGFSFKTYSGDALFNAIKKACDAFHSPEIWAQIVNTAMAQDYSWNRSAQAYDELYHRMLPTVITERRVAERRAAV